MGKRPSLNVILVEQIWELSCVSHRYRIKLQPYLNLIIVVLWTGLLLRPLLRLWDILLNVLRLLLLCKLWLLLLLLGLCFRLLQELWLVGWSYSFNMLLLISLPWSSVYYRTDILLFLLREPNSKLFDAAR